jgi:acyl-[acyl-carrier-protein]-phospholipid O-acyltransferase/long-chain-fatty-acid--[acyl-carrier-protein] ligase
MQELVQSSERTFAVACVPDPSRGERIVVLYTTLNGCEIGTLRKQLQDRGLSNLEIPGEKDFYQVPELPILGSGKLNLQKVKELALAAASGREISASASGGR